MGNLELLEEGSEAHMMRRSEDPMGAQFVFQRKPVEWTAVKAEDGTWGCHKVGDKPMGLYDAEEVHGEKGDQAKDGGSRDTNAAPDVGNIVVEVTGGRNPRTLEFHPC